ncbi:MAG: Cytochrome-c oxidase [Phycisphaerales bacterium]|nr:Cytochrome-c oxidase [Phycisphaerales bacterium]
MTAISAPISADHGPAHAHDAGHEISFIKKYIFSTDHKTIGIQFLMFGLLFFVVGGLLAMLVRWQLAWPEKAVPILGVHMGWDGGKMPPDYYNSVFSMHATLMIFFVIIPILVGAFGNYLIPLMIGAKDMAFPYLNGAAFWSALPAGAIMVAAFFLPGGPAGAGWTSYPPLSSTHPNGIKFHGHMPYRGTVDYIAPAPGWPTFVQSLRLHSTNIQTVDASALKSTSSGLEASYIGNKSEILGAVRDALVDKGYALVPVTGAADNVVSGQSIADSTNKATVTVTDDKITIAAKEGGPDLFKRIVAGLNWQSDWPALSVLTVAIALFLCFLYLCAYAVNTGVRPLNWGLSLVIAGVGAFYAVKGVQYLVFDGQSAWFLSLFILGFSSIMGAVNYLTTIVKLRCPGMTMFRMPLSVWALFITSLMVLLATPVLAATLFLNLLDHHRITSFFQPFNWSVNNTLQPNSGGGYPLLHQHLFWFYSHPAVYIMILPAMGMVSDILAANSRKPVFGYRPMIYALASIAFLGFIVWAHHMFQSGLNPTLGTTFAISTMFIAVPSAIKTFNWLGTLWGGNIRYTAAMLNAIAFVSMFVVGGLSGIYMASTAVDVQIHATYFIVAHIHYVLFGASTFGIFAAIYHWYPKIFGRLMNESLGKIHFWLSFISFNCTFFPMHILGIHGMPRRVADFRNYPTFAHFDKMNVFITISAFVLGLAQIPFVINFLGSWLWGRKAGRNPWQATTLEWETVSPPPHGNFEPMPVVYHGAYEYATPLVEEDFLAQTRQVEGADALAAAH